MKKKSLVEEVKYRLSLIEDNKAEFYTWEEVKSHLTKIRIKSIK